jgi:uncharacterized protein (TIGR03084 family)
MEEICTDLTAEHDALDAVLEGLRVEDWDAATPATNWSVRDQVSHLWFFDQRAILALTDVEAFAADAAVLLAGRGADESVEPGRTMRPADLLAAWRRDRRRLVDIARTVDPSARVPWYGPAMGAKSFITARLMETWAHGVDVTDTFGRAPSTSQRLRHVAHIGVRARPFAYAVRGLDMPPGEVRVELEAPDGSTWVWGEEGVPHRVRGTALEFCLVVVQRRNVADTDLEIDGDAAEEWMAIAQAFAGPPGPGRPPTAGRSA